MYLQKSAKVSKFRFSHKSLRIGSEINPYAQKLYKSLTKDDSMVGNLLFCQVLNLKLWKSTFLFMTSGEQPIWLLCFMVRQKECGGFHEHL